MANYKTYKDYIGFAEDNATWGTWQAPTKFLYCSKIDQPTLNRDIIDQNLIHGVPWKYTTDINTGFKSTSFNMSFPVPITGTDDAFLYILKHAFGKVTLTSAAPVYTHVFEPVGAQPSGGLAFSIASGGIRRAKTAGCRIASMKLASNVSGTIMCDLALDGKSFTEDYTMDTPSYSLLSARPLFWESPNSTVTIEFPSGSVLSNVVSWEATFVNELLTAPNQSSELGQYTFTQLEKNKETFTGKIVRRADETDGSGGHQSLFTEYTNNLADAIIKIKYEGAAVSGGAGQKYTLMLESNIQIVKKPVIANEASIPMETVEFEGRYDGTNLPLKVTVISGSSTPASYTP